jgi:hypothetical protein
MGEERKLYKVLVGQPKGRRPLGRPMRRWEDRIRMDIRDIGWGVWIGFDWIRIVSFSLVLVSFIYLVLVSFSYLVLVSEFVDSFIHLVLVSF